MKLLTRISLRSHVSSNLAGTSRKNVRGKHGIEVGMDDPLYRDLKSYLFLLLKSRCVYMGKRAG